MSFRLIKSYKNYGQRNSAALVFWLDIQKRQSDLDCRNFCTVKFYYFDDSEAEDSGLKLASNVKTSFVPLSVNDTIIIAQWHKLFKVICKNM